MTGDVGTDSGDRAPLGSPGLLDQGTDQAQQLLFLRAVTVSSEKVSDFDISHLTT
jgi:hypothetical protein